MRRRLGGGVGRLLVLGALLGKATGFLREVIMARLIGVSPIADAFRGALTASWIPIAPLQGDTVPAVLVPLHREWVREGKAARNFTALTAALVMLTVALTAMMILFAGWWTGLVVTGFDAETLALTRRFAMVMALAMPASVLFNCLVSVELSLGQARLATMRAMTQNLAVICGLVALAVTGQPILIAWAFTLAMNAVAGFGLVMLSREGALDLRGLRLPAMEATLRLFLRRLRPMLLQPVSEQGQLWVERVLASATAGAVASMEYARTMSDSALFVISQPLGLSVLAGSGERGRVAAMAGPLIALGVPASLYLAIYAPDLVTVVFARGAFTAEGVRLTGDALRGIASGLWASTFGWILVRQLNNERRNGRAAVFVATAYAANIAWNLLVGYRLGPLGFGLGEGLRGIVLLALTSVSLGCVLPILRSIRLVLPACFVLAAASWPIAQFGGGALLRAGLGGLVCAACVGVTLAVALPERTRMLLQRVRPLFRRS